MQTRLIYRDSRKAMLQRQLLQTSLQSSSRYLSLGAAHNLITSSKAVGVQVAPQTPSGSKAQPVRKSTSQITHCQSGYQPAKGVAEESSISGLSALLDGLKWSADGLIVVIAQVVHDGLSFCCKSEACQ